MEISRSASPPKADAATGSRPRNGCAPEGARETSVLRPAPLPGCMVLLPGDPVVPARCARSTTG